MNTYSTQGNMETKSTQLVAKWDLNPGLSDCST